MNVCTDAIPRHINALFSSEPRNGPSVQNSGFHCQKYLQSMVTRKNEMQDGFKGETENKINAKGAKS